MYQPEKITFKLLAAAQILALTLLSACTWNLPTTVCHATGDPANPYEAMTIDRTQWNEHQMHPGDINPVPVGGCPTTVLDIIDGKITICHATGSETKYYEEITVSVNGLDGHGKHPGDIIPAPESGCPTSPLPITEGKITICHLTGSDGNPYQEITVSVNGLNGHGKHAGDIIPVPADGCPTTSP